MALSVRRLFNKDHERFSCSGRSKHEHYVKKYEIEDKEAGREESQNCRRHAEESTERKKHGLTWHIPTMAGVVLDLPIEFERRLAQLDFVLMILIFAYILDKL